MPGCLVCGKEFLDGNLQIQTQIAGNIGNAKAAFSQDTTEQIAVHQDRSRRNMVRSRLISAGSQSTDGTGASAPTGLIQ